MKSFVIVCLEFIIFYCAVFCHQSHYHSNHENNQHLDGSKTQMHNSKMAQDIDHINEHLKEKIDLKKDLTPEELEFYYFMEHDFNNDSRLDGLEILAAIKHSDLAHDLNINTKNMSSEKQRESFDIEVKYYTDIIDEILKEDDFNNDGYLSYIEYALARRRDEIEENKRKSKNKDKNNV